MTAKTDGGSGESNPFPRSRDHGWDDLAREDPASDTLYGSLLRAREAGPGDRLAVAGMQDASTWVELSYDDLVAQVVAVSAQLAARGLEPGDVVCAQLPNWVEAVVYTYAAARLGAVVCPITTIYRRRELGFIVGRTRCKILVVPSVYRGHDFAATAAALDADVSTLEHVVVVGPTDVDGVVSGEQLRGADDDLVIPPAWTATDALAVLAFTSGTTGEPKGVMHSHASMHATVDDLVDHAGYPEGLTSLVMSPFGHLTGFVWGIVMPLRRAGVVVLLETWDPARALDLAAEYAVSFTMGATPFLADLLDAAAARPGAVFPDIFVCGGAPIPPVLVERAVREHGSRVVAVWGMSEYPVGTATAVGDDPALASRTDGRPVGSAEVLVVDAAGQPVAVGEEGDVIIRGPGLFLGYFARPDLDADALTTDGFLRTGDRARLLDDRAHLRISGRTKDIIIRGGENIPVVEIENLLLTLPGVKEVALVPIPHERLAEIACACLVLEPGAPTPSLADLGEFLAGHGVARQFTPEAVEVMSELPRTASGKIQKFALRERLTPSAPV